MPVNQEVMSDSQFYAFAHPAQNSRFYLALVFATLLFPLIAVALVAGTVFLIVPILAFFIWVGARVLFATLVGNSVLVSELNYPRVNTITEELKVKIGYQKKIYIFVYEHAHFNAYMRFIFFRRAIFLNSELLEAGVSDDEVRWVIGRFIGYMRARRQAGVLGWVIRAAQHLLIFNFFLLPYERAMVYTGDRLAVAAIGGDISSAVSAMQKLLVGRQLGYSLNPEGIFEQQRQIKGSVFALLARLLTGFPHMISRYVDLIIFAKVFFPAQFARFQASNPGLPADFQELAASRRTVRGAAQPGEAATPRRPHGWAWAAGTLVVASGLGFILWKSAQPDRTPQFSSTVAPPASSTVAPPANPPHVHRNAAGEWQPDIGCRWVSDAPTDLRVICR